METKSFDLRGIPMWLLQKYLRDLGGQPADDGWIAGPGWRCCLTPLPDAFVGRMEVNQIRLVWQAEGDAHALYWPRLEMRIMRGGG